jgi:hypothetical protein
MPVLWASGVHGVLDYLVMELLGPSLDNLYRKNGKAPFDLRSVCCIAIQMVCYLDHKLDLELNYQRSTALNLCTRRASSIGKLLVPSVTACSVNPVIYSWVTLSLVYLPTIRLYT